MAVGYLFGTKITKNDCGLARIVNTLEGWSDALAERGSEICPRLRQLAAKG